MAGHGELGAQRRSMAMVAMATRNAALPWLGWWHWRVREVEEMVAELWV